MSITFSKYVGITSGVAGASGVRLRDLIARIVSTNALLSPGQVYEFDNPTDVAEFFGASSEEANRANFYFGYVSPNITSPRKISYTRYAPAGAAPIVSGNTATKSLTNLKLIVAGVLNLVIGGIVVPIAGISFASAAALSDVAATLQTTLRANANPQLTTCTVAYNATTKQYVITGGVIENNTISVAQAGAGVTDVGATMGLYVASGAVNLAGSAPKTAVQTVTDMVDGNNNFGSFMFTTASVLTIDDHVAVAQYNDALNVQFMYLVAVAPSDSATWAAALLNLSGCGLILASPAGTASPEYPEMCPAALQASTDYTKRNAAINYMFKAFNLTPSVTTTLSSNTYDALRINYYGQTQTAGQPISFFQRGVLMGTATDPVDMNTYSNEQWLKDTMGAQLMGLLLALGRVSANTAGKGQITAVINTVVQAALFNGVISVGKTLDINQRLYISQATDDPLAWFQVQGSGWWLTVDVQSYVTTDGRTEYKAVYLLIYSKDDTIRKVEGTHSLV